ncbi:CubicO group peptidase, beta-lactamase class C family [Marivirga sericea]|uniref:CubicO group peptidase, beta-lactamase class C family n=1 Tax=Marivirga sericea TaxID=1028 RepID=A0A1X7K4S5_9BACT|nr:serine hydrolase [Marivirga sericea]SMG35685.1 CubicO group peptidase, beta-lactamase class C family [Marivirga sericea]
MKKIILFWALLMSVNTVFAQTSLPAIKPSILDSIALSYCNPGEPGMAIGIVINGETVFKNSKGIADLTNNLQITDSSTFNIASVSKQFTAFLTLIAEKEGKFNLSDDIRQYLPELKTLPHKITIQQLANHSHGLPNYSDLIEMIGFGLSSPLSNIQVVETLLNVKQVSFKPGTKYQYGNSGFILLAEILKRVYDKPFTVLMKEKVFDALKMTHTAIIDDPNTIVKNKANAYKKKGDSFTKFPSRQMESGSSNVYTTLNDMLKWAVYFQNPPEDDENRIRQLSQSTISITKTGDLHYGLGLYTETYKGLKLIFHGGGTAGYRAYILHVPEHNFSIFTLGNKEGFDALHVIYDILDLYFDQHFEEPIREKISPTKKELEAYAGTYRFQPGQYWGFNVENERLYFNGIDKPLSWVANSKFDFFLPLSNITFHPNSMEFRIGDMNYQCEKIEVNPPVLSLDELKVYEGIYKNEEFNIFYELLLKEDKLVAKHLTNGEIILNPLSENSFYAEYPLGELNFKLSQNGEVKGFTLSGQNYNDITFVKVN